MDKCFCKKFLKSSFFFVVLLLFYFMKNENFAKNKSVDDLKLEVIVFLKFVIHRLPEKLRL